MTAFTSVTLATAVKSAVRSHGQVVAMIHAIFKAERFAAGTTFAGVVGILLDPKQTKAEDKERETMVATFRRTAQRELATECLLPPVFLIDNKDKACRVVLLPKDATEADVKAANLPTREANKALAAIALRDYKAAKPESEADAGENENDNDKDSQLGDTDKSAPGAAAPVGDLLAALASMDATALSELMAELAKANPAQLVLIAEAVNGAMKTADKKQANVSQLGSYKVASVASVQTMADGEPADVVAVASPSLPTSAPKRKRRA